MNAHSAASVRSRSSRSPSQSHSASPSVSSSARNRKPASNRQTPPLPHSYSDTRDDDLTSNEEQEIMSESESEEEVSNDEEYEGSMTASFENKAYPRNRTLKSDNSSMKIDSSTSLRIGNEERGLTASVSSAWPEMNSISGIGVKEDSAMGIFSQNTGAYTAREESIKMEEEAGRIKFVCVSNDGIDEHLIWLIGLKNIFAKQLPKMPKEYIVRLIMDRNHKSVMIIRHNKAIGGITYRPYVSQNFGEIAFCAIQAGEQEKGYGTRLMNHLKQHARDVDGLTHFLTCADKNAVKYFTKQGFTEEIDLEEDKWQGYIREYEGVVLMECKLIPKFPYTDFPTVIRQQRQAVEKKIREFSNCHIVYPGIDFQKKEAGIPKKVIKVEDIPGLREAGWTPDASTYSATDRHSLNLFMRALLKMVHDSPDAWPFKEPVDSREVPDYYEIIKDPIDLRTISKRLESERYYITFEMFVSDVERMFNNARKYNSPDTIYYKCATRMKNLFFNKIQACRKVRH